MCVCVCVSLCLCVSVCVSGALQRCADMILIHFQAPHSPTHYHAQTALHLRLSFAAAVCRRWTTGIRSCREHLRAQRRSIRTRRRSYPGGTTGLSSLRTPSRGNARRSTRCSGCRIPRWWWCSICIGWGQEGFRTSGCSRLWVWLFRACLFWRIYLSIIDETPLMHLRACSFKLIHTRFTYTHTHHKPHSR